MLCLNKQISPRYIALSIFHKDFVPDGKKV